MFTTRELADRLHVSPAAIQKWGRQGLIKKCYHDGLRDLWEAPVGHAVVKGTAGRAGSAHLVPIVTPLSE